jgi:hypothetical protein
MLTWHVPYLGWTRLPAEVSEFEITLGMIRFEPTDTDKLLPSLCDVVRAGVSGDHLLTATRKLLHESRFVIPGTRRLSNLMQAAVSKVEHDALSAIERRIPVLIRNQWLDGLSRLADPERKATLLEYLQEPPAKFSPTTIDRQSGKVAALRNLGVDTYKTDMAPALLQSYAQGMRKRRPSRFHQLQEPRRTLELVAFMRHALLEHTDNLIRLLDRRVARLWGRASEEARRTREEGSASNLFVDAVRSVLATASESFDERIATITSLLADLDGQQQPHWRARQHHYARWRLQTRAPICANVRAQDRRPCLARYRCYQCSRSRSRHCEGPGMVGSRQHRHYTHL